MGVQHREVEVDENGKVLSFGHTESRPHCKICLSGQVEDIIYRQGVYRCLDCGCLFRPKPIDYDWYTEVDYWYKGDESLKRYQKSLYAWFDGYFLQGDTIEFGAADGDFTFLLRHLIVPEHKVVYSELVDMLRPTYTLLDIEKSIGSFEDVAPIQPREAFANVCMIDVLEHIHNPVGALQTVYNLLAPGGRFFMVTNNGDIPDIHDEMYRHQEHVVMLTQRGIDKLCLVTGFVLINYFVSPQGLSFTILQKMRRG